jgi:hypothetical protein
MAFGSSGPGVDLQVSAVDILFFAQHIFQLQVLNEPEGLLILVVDLLLANFSFIIKVQVNLELFQVGFDLIKGVGPFLEIGDVFEFFLCRLRVVPEIGRLCFFFFFFDAYLQVIDVKDTSSAHPGAFRSAVCCLLQS